MLVVSIAINRAEHVCTTVIIKHNHIHNVHHKVIVHIMLSILYAKITVSQKKFVPKLSSKQTARLLFS